MWKLKVGEGGPWLTTEHNHLGRQHWEFDPDAGTPEERAHVDRLRQEFSKNRFRNKQSADLLVRMQLRKENGTVEPIPAAVKVKETDDITEKAVETTLRRALIFFSSIQACDGHWPAQLSGGLFFMPPLIIVSYITGTLNVAFGPEHRKEIIRYIHNHQNEDGGWGLHEESQSTMFGSAENYIALRLLGESPEDSVVAKGRKWILDHGGAVGVSSWGKFWLAVLGVYEWSGCNPVPPEFWLLPRLFFFHPGKLLPLARMIFLPMSYLYGKKFVGPITQLVLSLRQELHTEPYFKINWNKARNTIAKEDLYYPHPYMQDMLWAFLHHVAEPILARWPFSMLREKALEVAIEHVHYEDKVTNFLWIGSEEKGNGSQIWDTILGVQAIASCNLNDKYGLTLRKAHEFLKATQATLLLSQISPALVGEKMDSECFYDAVNLLLSYQSSNGGFPAWEPQKAFRWLEKLNPVEFLQDSLIEREYVECTSSVIQSLVLFRKLYPNHRTKEIDTCVSKGLSYILSTQNPDGSWYGRWGVCYTYGTWFAVEALVACERSYHNSLSLRKACQFLLSKQLPNGGWGESYLSCKNEVYTNLEGNYSNVVQTSWALLALIAAGQGEIDPKPIHRGIRLLINAQMEDGDFPEKGMNGVFMKNCTLNYSSYRNIFTIWAFGEYRKRISIA